MRKDTKEGRISKSRKTEVKQVLILVVKIILLTLLTFKEEKVDRYFKK